MAGRAAAIAANQALQRHVIGLAKIRKELQDGHQNIGFHDNKHHAAFVGHVKKVRDSALFQRTLIATILVAGAEVGLQTYEITDTLVNAITDIIDTVVLVIFIVEIVVKLLAEGRYPWRYFQDSWNRFDFLVVVSGLLPFGGGAITALRLVRLIRVLKLLRALPKLRILVMALIQSMSSIAYIGLLLGLLFYLYAVVGVIVFGENDPVYFGELHSAILTLMRCSTLDSWAIIMRTQVYGCDRAGYEFMPTQCVSPNPQPGIAVPYFVSFIVLSAMMILNLFIGVIAGSMVDAKNALAAETSAEAALDPEKLAGEATAKTNDHEVINEDQLEEEIGKRFIKVSVLLTTLAAEVAELRHEHQAVKANRGLTGMLTRAPSMGSIMRY